MALAEFYSGWLGPPNGFAQYRLHLVINVASQDVDGNATTLSWDTYLEKSRSQNGFYTYPGTSGHVDINGTRVQTISGTAPNAPWTGWSSWHLGSGTIVIVHNPDGTAVNLPVSASYNGTNVGWSIGAISLAGVVDLPAIARATAPTVTPSPASIGAEVTIGLPRASAAFTHDLTWVSGSLSGTIATDVDDTQAWTVPNVMSEFPGKATGPIVITAITKNGATILGSRQVTLLAKNPPAPPTIKAHTPGDQFDIRARLVKYTGGEWAARQQLPANAVTLVDSASATATCTISLSKLNAVDFADYSIVDIDVFDGANWLFTNHRFVLTRSDEDGVDPTKVGTYTGTEFLDYVLGFAYVQGGYDWDGLDQHFAPTTPGEIIRYAIADAQSRGWGPRIGITFDGSKTSLGEPWANTAVNRSYSKGTPLSQILSGLVEDGLVEYRTEYYDNKAWLVLLNPGTGSDYSAVGADPVVNLGLAKLSRAPRRSTMEKQLTAVTVVGDDTVQVTRTKAAFDADLFGRMEGWVAASGVKDAGSANAIGDNALRDNSTPTNERTFEYQAQDVASQPQFYPYSVFRPHDWVLIPSADGAVKDRISQVTIAKTGDDSLSLTVLTGDRILSGTASLAKRQSAQTGGAISGGSGMTPSPLDSRIPSGPVIDTITSEGYWNTDGAAKSAVTITWAAVATALNGASIPIDLYEVYWRPSGVDAQWAFKGATDELSIELGDWDVLKPIDLRVRARSAAGIYGEFSEDQEHTTQAPPVDLHGPIITDLYTDGVGSIYIVWAGVLGTDPAPARMAYVTAEISTDGVSYVSAGTPITAAGTIIVNPGAYGDYFVRLRPYDRLGNPGTASDPQAIATSDPRVAAERPEPPTGLTVTAGAGWGASGFLPEAWFDLEWTVPTLDTDGDPIEVVGYDVLGLRSGETIERFLTSTTTNGVRIPVGNGETWSLRVTAASNLGGVSDPSAVVTKTADALISVAAAPTAPTLDQYAGLLRIKWAGGGMVPQIKYAYAAISTTVGGVYSRAGMPLLGAGEVVVPGLAPGDYWAKIVMVDELGNASTSPASAPITLLPITGVTIQTSAVANTGIKMTSGALTAYDVSGNPTFILNAATGEVWIAPYDSVFDLGASGTVATTGAATTGIAISSDGLSFNTFIHPSGLQIRNDQTALSWWEADATDASLVNFFSPRAVIGQRLRVGDYEMLREAKAVGSRLVYRYKGD